jgi:hypothetical protein
MWTNAYQASAAASATMPANPEFRTAGDTSSSVAWNASLR